MSTPAPPPRASRAGRNLPVAIAVGLALGAVVLVPLYTYRPVFGLVVAVAIAYACFELTSVLRDAAGRHVPLVPLVAGTAATYYAAYNRGSRALAVGIVLSALAVLAWRAVAAAADREAPGAHLARDVAASLWVLVYLVLLGGFAQLMTAPHDGARRVVTFVVTVVCADVGGYAAGVLVGRHPLAPRISPKKSWEGLAGSAAACLVAGGLLFGLLFGVPAWKGLVFGLAMTATAIVGDLAESLVKRDLGIKDMGRLLPGHGGIMDRIDSLLISAPVAYLLLAAFVPV
ncbi:MAG TPA: phosphatidate cytidylyltransferase [Mycobacteriales bacterium]